MTSPRFNQQRSANPARATYFSWDEFDAFPRLIRDLMNYTPHAVGTGFVHRQLQAGLPLQVVARQAHARWSAYARQETLALYGPDHPQAQSHAA